MGLGFSINLSKGKQIPEQIIKAEQIQAQEQVPPPGSPPGTPEYMWDWPMYKIWYAYYQSKVYHYYFGGISIFDE